MPCCLFYWSPSLNMRSTTGDNHHKDPTIYFSLTSSRIDSIRTLQSLISCNVVMLVINVNGDAEYAGYELYLLRVLTFNLELEMNCPLLFVLKSLSNQGQ